jgi:hypothetical protein
MSRRLLLSTLTNLVGHIFARDLGQQRRSKVFLGWPDEAVAGAASPPAYALWTPTLRRPSMNPTQAREGGRWACLVWWTSGVCELRLRE